MTKEQAKLRYKRKCFEVRTIIEDCAANLMMAGASNRVAFELMMRQAALRIAMEGGDAVVRRILREIEADLDDGGGDDEAA